MLTLEKPKRHRLRATNHKASIPKEKQITGKSPILEILEQKQAQNLAIGVVTSLWALFAPMLSIQTSGTVKPFEPYDYQIDLIQTIEENTNIACVKSRQMGVSECACSYLLMRALTEPGFSAVVFSKTQEDSSELGRRIRDSALSLGSLCPELASESAKKLAFKGLGKIYFLPVTARAARGIPSVSVVLFDEAAFIDGIDGVYQAAMPTLSMLGDKGKVIFLSTPNGRSGLFYRLLVAGVGEAQRVTTSLQEVRQAANDIKPFERKDKHTRSWVCRKWAKVFLHWRVHPIYGHDPNWAEKTREERQLTQAQWDQEYELDFGVSGRFVFDLEKIEQLSIGAWQAPQFAHRYLAGIDPSFGGEDFFTVRIWDITKLPYQLVAEFRQNFKSKDYYVEQTLTLLDRYKPVLTGIETNSGGALYFQDLIKQRPRMTIAGLNMSGTSKPVHTDRLVLMAERSELNFPPDAATEYLHFVEHISKSRTRKAEAGYHDDTVMADAVAFAFIDEVPPVRSYTSSSSGNREVHSSASVI
jgi:hypothetical protein